MDKELRNVHEEYLLRLGTNKLQVEAVKKVLGVESQLSNDDFSNSLIYPSKRLSGLETKLDDHHYHHMIKQTLNPNYTQSTLSGTWFRVSNFSGQFLRIAGKGKKDANHEVLINKIIDDLCPLNAPSKDYINVTILLPNLEIEENKYYQHHELEGYNAKWDWYKLRHSQVKDQIENDPTWSLKLFLAFSFMGLADSSIDKKNGSKLLYNMLNTSNSLQDFNIYDSTLYDDWLQSGEKDPMPAEVDNIFTQTLENSAYLTVSDKILKALDEPELARQHPIPTVTLHCDQSSKFASTSALKDRGSKDPSHFINSARNIRLGLNYLFCMTSGTAITLQIPIESISTKMKHWQLNTPLIIAPIEWIKLIEGTKKKKTGNKREKYDANKIPANKDGSPFQFKDLQNMTDAQKHKLMSEMLEKSIDVNDDADLSGQLYRGMPHINLDEEW